ncbi:MAG: nuclear transport factor 2 family protein [Thermoleophilia bacterium]|nr:nuclear transport factor 2 family protein [Thermoleophilia bacterium]
MHETREVVQRYLEALKSGDVDAVTANFAADIVLLCPEERVVGIDAFCAACKEMFSGLLAPGTYARTVEHFVVEGDLALVTWSAACLGARMQYGTTSFVVRDGLITRMAAAYQIVSD